MSGEAQSHKQTECCHVIKNGCLRTHLKAVSLPAPTGHFLRILMYLLLICSSSCPIRTAATGEADVRSGAQGSHRGAALLRRGKPTACHQVSVHV